MKRICIIICMMLFWCKAEAMIDLNKIEQIESNGNSLAYNKLSKARGLYQITPICLKDYNRSNSPKIAPADLFNPKYNKKVAEWYLTRRIPLLLQKKGIPVTSDNILIAYNWGIKNAKRYVEGKTKLPKETANYIKKYNKLGKK